ncbi:hypothetical protein EX30DRAFT_353296 [Ascodesmis nigricans]|uniref:Bicarbonate transporter-like transmembrane domain-containing protein n=1 Tax=Ascodesmis nigricans TaxID=341454 RepID=A0A4S2N7W4_9PEZI|nr:hypothetical protein EX30DRAFT_353296 [Ascodesmis nigricans]
MSSTGNEKEPSHFALPSPYQSPFRRWFAPKTGALRPFRLLKEDIRNYRTRLRSDWYFNQLILASAVYVFFTNLLPGITFSSDLYVKTDRNYGTIEVVLSTGICGIVFALFSAQPLTILGVTGPFCILSETIFDLCRDQFQIPYLPFMAWACLHSTWMHLLLAIFNAHDWTMGYVTTFSTEIFSLLNSIIYFHKSIQELERVHRNTSFASFLYSVIGCIGTFLVAVFLSTATKWKPPIFHKYIRMGLSEYAAAISIIFWIGMPNVGELADLNQERLPVSKTFSPTHPDRSVFFVEFWKLDVAWIFAAIIPGLIITTLFFFDVEVSTICATLPRYNIQKPGGYAWDVVLLGLTTGLCGILGIPPANGLLPQAPLHSESLLHKIPDPNYRPPSASTSIENTTTAHLDPPPKVQRVHEQRWSHLLHAVGIFAFTSPPLMHVLGLTPTSVLAGLFLFMGQQSLCTNPILYRFLDMLTPISVLEKPTQLGGSGKALPRGVSWTGVNMYNITQILLTVGIFVITFTKAAVAFPVVIVALVPVRLKWMRKWWARETLISLQGQV